MLLRYAHANHLNDFDWFLKCDDDSYIIMENLRLTLSQYSPDDPWLMGRRFKPFTPQGYMSGGAGYVLSRKAVDKLVTEAMRTPKVCKINDDTGAEDAEMGKCLYGVGVKIADSRDEEGRQRFFPFTPESHLTENYCKSYLFNFCQRVFHLSLLTIRFWSLDLAIRLLPLATWPSLL